MVAQVRGNGVDVNLKRLPKQHAYPDTLRRKRLSSCPEQVKGDNADVNVKRLPKRPVPPRFGRKLTAAQRETATPHLRRLRLDLLPEGALRDAARRVPVRARPPEY